MTTCARQVLKAVIATGSSWLMWDTATAWVWRTLSSYIIIRSVLLIQVFLVYIHESRMILRAMKRPLQFLRMMDSLSKTKSKILILQTEFSFLTIRGFCFHALKKLLHTSRCGEHGTYIHDIPWMWRKEWVFKRQYWTWKSSSSNNACTEDRLFAWKNAPKKEVHHTADEPLLMLNYGDMRKQEPREACAWLFHDISSLRPLKPSSVLSNGLRGASWLNSVRRIFSRDGIDMQMRLTAASYIRKSGTPGFGYTLWAIQVRYSTQNHVHLLGFFPSCKWWDY